MKAANESFDKIEIPIGKYEIREIDSKNPKDAVGNKKAPLCLMPPAGIIHGALAMRDGARKYGPYNYRDKKINVMIYLDAILRHTLAYLDGEEVAEDSGVHHMGHVIANAAIILDSTELHTLEDNRPTKGPAGDLLSAI